MSFHLSLKCRPHKVSLKMFNLNRDSLCYDATKKLAKNNIYSQLIKSKDIIINLYVSFFYIIFLFILNVHRTERKQISLIYFQKKIYLLFNLHFILKLLTALRIWKKTISCIFNESLVDNKFIKKTNNTIIRHML